MTKATAIYEYPVRRQFTYKGKVYEPGDMWSPQGERNDQKIIDMNIVDESQATIAGTRQASGYTPEEILGIDGLTKTSRQALEDYFGMGETDDAAG